MAVRGEGVGLDKGEVEGVCMETTAQIAAIRSG